MSSIPPDYLTISYRPDLDVLVGRWMRQVTLDEMRQGYELLLEEAAQHHCRQWLIDVRRRFNTDREGAQWMVTEFLPRLQPRLGGYTHLAYLLAPIIMRDAEADAAFPTANALAGKPFMGERFTDEREAIEWLQHRRQL
ncbi:hypothetical protein [Hymenobacter wooponensis]|uniref:STAS/SEC14 domain-containing protein n=1 Tax=Hymenobacter wooponensis TaxID=1525360 RepID=A0A4Z0MEQ8_9BACT|nr:hypothetical protein [Hymenobacter wooponensis]TGD77847.1 hypothetical protein EU557_21365 [Hymenobacter wooponensis]